MLPEIQNLFETLENKRQKLVEELGTLSEEELAKQPGPDRWSILMTLEHIIIAEKGIRLSEAKVRGKAGPEDLKDPKMFQIVMDVLEKDIQVDVPHPALEPSGNKSIRDLLDIWAEERLALKQTLETINTDNMQEPIFAHPVTGPIDTVRTLKLAIAHFDTHERQIQKIKDEINDGNRP